MSPKMEIVAHYDRWNKKRCGLFVTDTRQARDAIKFISFISVINKYKTISIRLNLQF